MRVVDQPGPCAVVGVVGVALPGGEPGQDKGPRRREDRVGLFSSRRHSACVAADSWAASAAAR
jgi:hypothetical protein